MPDIFGYFALGTMAPRMIEPIEMRYFSETLLYIVLYAYYELGNTRV